MLNSIFTGGTITAEGLLVMLALAMVLGVLAAFLYQKKNACTRSFVVTLAILPLITAAVILVVNGNLGAGIAVAGAFSLIRFRSVQGSAREILAVFLSMALGLCLGAGYVAVACATLALYAVMLWGLDLLRLGSGGDDERELKITIPESLDYDGIFDDVLARDTVSCRLESVKTAELGSVYKLTYRVRMRAEAQAKHMLDDLRIRNGNLPVSLGRVPDGGAEL